MRIWEGPRFGCFLSSAINSEAGLSPAKGENWKCPFFLWWSGNWNCGSYFLWIVNWDYVIFRSNMLICCRLSEKCKSKLCQMSHRNVILNNVSFFRNVKLSFSSLRNVIRNYVIFLINVNWNCQFPLEILNESSNVIFHKFETQ